MCASWRVRVGPCTDHLLRLAEVHVLLGPTACPGVLDVHEADEGHGAAAQQQDGEEHDDNGGGANELPLLHGLQVQVQAQGIGDSTPQAWETAVSQWARKEEEVAAPGARGQLQREPGPAGTLGEVTRSGSNGDP